MRVVCVSRWWFSPLALVEHLTESLWTAELEHALEMFSIQTYLDWIDQHHIKDLGNALDNAPAREFPERFLNYLEGKVSSPFC